MLKKGIIVLLLVLVLSASAYSEQSKKSDILAYVLAGGVGFGVGHFYIGSDHAMKFLLLEGGSVAVMVVGEIIAASATASLYSLNATTATNAMGVGAIGGGIALVGGLAWLGFHVWDFIDIFGEVDKKKAEGVVALRPSVGFGPGGQTTVALSYNY